MLSPKPILGPQEGFRPVWCPLRYSKIKIKKYGKKINKSFLKNYNMQDYYANSCRSEDPGMKTIYMEDLGASVPYVFLCAINYNFLTRMEL